ncbi:MAG: hypothetical protein ACM3IH_14110 [Sphingobacteriales bacterium]
MKTDIVDIGDNRIVVASEDDVEEVLDHNKFLQTIEQKSDWGRHVADIPAIILTRWLNEEWNRGNTTIRVGGEEFMQIIKRKLQDPEWKYLRTDCRSAMIGHGS